MPKKKQVKEEKDEMREALKEEAISILERTIPTHELNDTQVMLVALEAMGTLQFMGEGADIQRVVKIKQHLNKYPTVLHMQVAAALRTLDGMDLDRARFALARLLPQLPLHEDEGLREADEQQVLDCVATRDRYELILEGAKIVFGATPELSGDFELSLASFDVFLHEHNWQLLYLGSQKTARAVWAAPAYRGRLWWWSNGLRLPDNALDSLVTAASVLNQFPAARDHFESLVKACALIGD